MRKDYPVLLRYSLQLDAYPVCYDQVDPLSLDRHALVYDVYTPLPFIRYPSQIEFMAECSFLD